MIYRLRLIVFQREARPKRSLVFNTDLIIFEIIVSSKNLGQPAFADQPPEKRINSKECKRI